ncbi:lysosome-associated membrane glycoprotein 3 [Anolis carolinensis]|uniref:Lysosome-associated membrane glycoprotein 3 n=1 Tax=Anolis carolinensis TaxID=28377 RepID=G1KGN9_ANOCA|nr:PREDICTED: lysosome-associated membrane glycoprotein 3 [Anolis carolinensis]|eukprot:XP_003218146.1 PREDICTED: lysosome-associated membrane glycoprotein 3 [Anolis carolinensis]
MIWKNLFVEFLLITANVLFCCGEMLNNGSKAKATQPFNSLLFLSNHLFTTPPQSKVEASFTRFVHGIAQPANQEAYSIQKEKVITDKPMPSSADKITDHTQEKTTVDPKMMSAKPTGQHIVYTVVKTTDVARGAGRQTEPLLDRIRSHTENRKTLATEMTTLQAGSPKVQKTATLIQPVVMANTNKTVSETGHIYTTQSATKRTTGIVHKNITSVVSTAPKPTTPVGPTLAPKLSPAATGTYRVLNGTANCIKALMGLTLIAKNRNTNQMEYFNIDPNATQTTGICGALLSVLKISFQDGFISFTFHKNGEEYYVSLVEATLTVPSEGVPYVGMKSDKLFSVQVGNCFKCASPQTLDMSEDLQLLVENSQLQAFDDIGDTFGTAEMCALDRNKKLIPITVTLSLVGLFIIVLVTCVIYRRKPISGYESI